MTATLKWGVCGIRTCVSTVQRSSLHCYFCILLTRGVSQTIEDPGCSVDIPGFCYHLSFAEKPVFTRLYPPQEEIQAYLTSVARHFSVHEHFTGCLDWIGCQWDDTTREWVVELRDVISDQRYLQRCRVLVSCVGGLTNPYEPSFPGRTQFRGPIMHTAKWDQTIDFRGKRVIVIGNGGTKTSADVFVLKTPVLTCFLASAAQLIPALVGEPFSIQQIVRVSDHCLIFHPHEPLVSFGLKERMCRHQSIWFQVRTLACLGLHSCCCIPSPVCGSFYGY
jgi:hypothetical protein